MSSTFSGSRFVLPPDLNTAAFPVASGVVISIGDFLYWDSANSVVKPLSAKTGSGSAVVDQADVSATFAGVAQQARIAAQTTSGYPAYPANGISVNQNCIYEADCDAATFEPGDLVGVVSAAATAAGDIQDQKVVKVTKANLAIGYVVARYPSSTTTVRVRLLGKVSEFNNPNLEGIGSRQGFASGTLADSNVTLTVASAPIQVGVPTAARDITLPAVAYSGGLVFYIVNNSAGAFTYTVKNAAASTIVSVAQNKRAQVFCDGAAWYGLVGA
jgi:hypothetical protein